MDGENGRRKFMKSMLGAVVAPYALGTIKSANAQAPTGGSAGPKTYLEPFNYEGVHLLDGRLKKQFTATRDYFYNLADDDLLKGFRARAGMPAPGNDLGGWYSGEKGVLGNPWWTAGDFFHTFGQWLSGMARMSKATGDQALSQKVVHLMLEWGKTIEPDGYFFFSRNPNAPHYTYEKTVCGLVDLYEYGGRKDALGFLEKITDWAVNNLDRSRKPAGGGEWYTLSENLYRAYALTGNSKYKTFGDVWRYTDYWKAFTTGSEMKRSGHHAYSHVNTLSSAAMTYQVTGEPEYLQTIVNAYEWLEQTQLYPTGGYGPDELLVPGAAWATHPSLGEALETTAKSFETICGSWAGFKLGRYLLRFTGEARYGDWIEKLVYNGVGAALPMAGRGQAFYYSDYRLGGGRKVYFTDGNWPCCSGTLPQSIADYHNLIYFKDPNNLYVNLFVPSAVTWNHGDTEVWVEQETSYPESDTTTLTVRPSKTAQFGLKFRVPMWTQGAKVFVNGSALRVKCEPGTWATVNRTWMKADRVVIQLPMRLAFVPIDEQHPNRVALKYGPVVLVRDQQAVLHPKGDELSKWITPTFKALEFDAVGQKQGVFVPFYRLGLGTPYNMYFDLQA
jgi:DUF1680 family protein